jgi:hypothetical protein
VEDKFVPLLQRFFPQLDGNDFGDLVHKCFGYDVQAFVRLMKFSSPKLNDVQMADALASAGLPRNLREFVGAMLQAFQLRGGRLI